MIFDAERELEIDLHLACLDDPDDSVHAAAAAHLGSLRARSAVPALLRSVIPRLSGAAIHALAEIGDETAIPVLMLAKLFPPIEGDASVALQRFRTPAARATFAQFLRNRFAPLSLRITAIIHLGCIVGEDARRDLRRALSDDVPLIRYHSVIALSADLDGPTVAAIEACRTDAESFVREAAHDALDAFRPGATRA